MFVLDKDLDHHSTYNLFKVFLFGYDVDGSNTSILSKARFVLYFFRNNFSYLKILHQVIDFTYYRMTRNSGKLNAMTSQSIPQNLLKEFLLPFKQHTYSLFCMYMQVVSVTRLRSPFREKQSSLVNMKILCIL